MSGLTAEDHARLRRYRRFWRRWLRAVQCDCYISPGCGRWHCEACLSTPLLHGAFWRDDAWHEFKWRLLKIKRAARRRTR